MDDVETTKRKPHFTMGGLIQFIGLLGIIFCVINLFTKFNFGFSAWWIFGISVACYVLGMISGATLTLEVKASKKETDNTESV